MADQLIPNLTGAYGHPVYLHSRKDDQRFNLADGSGEWHNLIGQPDHTVIESDMRATILAQFDPDKIGREIQETIRTRQIARRWLAMTDHKWDYGPLFDASQDAIELYL